MTPPAAAGRRDAKPVVLVPACNRMLSHFCFHVVAKQYVDAVWLSGCQPLIVPGADPKELDEWIDAARITADTVSPIACSRAAVGRHHHRS